MVRKEAKKVVLKDAEGNYIVPVIDPADKGGGYTPNIFDMKWSDHLQNDIRWLRGDTFSWQPGTVYETAYNKLVQEYDDTSSVVTVNASKVGAVNLSDNGIASGFTTTAYLSKAITLSSDRTNVFPIRFNITTGGNITTEQYIAAVDGWCMQLSIGTDSKFHLYLGTGSSWDIADGTAGQTVLSANTNYELVLDYDGNEYTLQVITNGSTPTVVNDIVLASTTMICTGARNLYIGTDGGHTIPFLGTINVPGCSIDNSWHGTFSKTSKNGFVILDSMQEQYAIQRFANEGVAWYYILDKTNHRFKLPRTKYDFAGLGDNVGGYVAESLPNIKQYLGRVEYPSSGPTQATIEHKAENATFNEVSYVGDTLAYITFNANNTNSVYKDNAPVQQRATQMYLYFYVGDYAQTAVEQTAGLNAELFNTKVDKSDLQLCHVVVSTYKNGTSWYRIYDDGWCEQGGFIPSQTRNDNFQVTLLKEFVDTNYNLITNKWIVTNVSTNVMSYSFYTKNKTTNGFTTAVDENVACSWRACGYLVEGEY